MNSPAPKIEFMPREDFAELSLQAKNDYLQDLANRFATATSRPATTLDKDALSRLRRFYARRSIAELGLETKPIRDKELADALTRLGNAIKNADRKTDVLAGISAELPAAQPVLRTAPLDDAQLAFFVPTIYDAPIKDDINLMDIAPFALSKKKTATKIVYELKDSLITIEGNPKFGMATAFDYDIFLHMMTSLAEETRLYRESVAKGRRTEAPAQVYQPNAAHILKFCRRGTGGKQYSDLEAALHRLATTHITIVNLTGGNRREVTSIPLIGAWTVSSRTTTGHVDRVNIGIPDWVYNTIVRTRTAPAILTINPDYFLIGQGIGRVIYRLARKAAGKDKAQYGLTELHKRSGSTQNRSSFAYMLRAFVASTKTFELPDYDLDLIDGRTEPKLVMTYRNAPQQRLPLG